MTLREQIKESLIESRNNILEGGVNCIPSKLTRFRQDFPGIRKKFYYLITGATKSSKTQFTNYMFIPNRTASTFATPAPETGVSCNPGW